MGIAIAAVLILIAIFSWLFIHGADARTNQYYREMEDEEQMKAVSKMKDTRKQK